MTTRRPLRLHERDGDTVLRIELGAMGSSDVEVASAGPNLLIKVRDAQRLVALPDSVAGREVRLAEMREGVLEVVFAR